MRAEERRTAILASALAVVAARGFAATTTRAIAEHAGITHSLLHRYFPTRAELLAAAFDAEAEREIRRFAALSEIADFDVVFDDFCTPVDRNHYLLWIDAWSEAGRVPALRRSLARHHRAWLAATVGVIERGNGLGRWTCDDPVIAADRVLASFDGNAVQRYVFRHLTARAHRDANLLAVVTILRNP